LLAAAGLLFFNYRHTKSPGARGKIRILALGGIIIVMLLVILTFIPDALFHQPIIPFSYSVVLLIFLPLTYGYSIFRFHLIEIERYVNRSATVILVYVILSGIYFFLYWLFQQQTWIPQKSVSFISTIFVLFLASIYTPLYKQVRKFVDTVFYGGWYDYRSGITKMTQGLNQITDLKVLAKVISERLINTLRLEDACVFLKDEKGDFSVIEVSSGSGSDSMKRPEPESIPKKSLTYLLKVGVIERKNLREELKDVELTPEELQLLNSEQIHLWVPIVVHGEIQGLMALGQKIGGDVYSGEDMDILRIVAMQIGPVIENIHLLSQLKQYAADLEKRVAERTLELYTSKERIATILASVGDGVVVTDLDGTIVMVNKAFENQTGFTEKELIGDNFFIILQKENEREILKNMQKTLLSGSVWSGELISRQKNKSLNDVQLTIAPVRDQIGKMISFVGSQRDVTRQKELERLKDMFVADVSHELRTPTTNINLYLELLESAPSEKKDHYIDVIKEQGKLLSRLVEDILDLSTLAMSRVKKVEFSPVNLNLLAEQVITAHQPVADASGIRLLFEPDPLLPSIMGEQNQIARLINNLVSNAVRYTKEGEVKITTYQDSNDVVVKVEDTGIGIDIEDIPHIFERFYRGKYVRQTNIHGTGLGLAIVKEIMDLHEGNIRVDSIYGKGSTFYAIFPKKRKKSKSEEYIDEALKN
jgi:PAS domain S-box-containing protein